MRTFKLHPAPRGLRPFRFPLRPRLIPVVVPFCRLQKSSHPWYTWVQFFLPGGNETEFIFGTAGRAILYPVRTMAEISLVEF